MNPSPHAATTSTVVTRSRSRALQRPRNISRSRQESSSEREENMDSSMEVEPRRRRTSSSTRNNQEDERSLAMSEDPMETSPTRHERDDGDHDTLELHGGLGSEMAVEIINHGGSRRRDSHEGMASEQVQPADVSVRMIERCTAAAVKEKPASADCFWQLLATYEGINRKYYETHSQRNDYDDENGDYIIRVELAVDLLRVLPDVPSTGWRCNQRKVCTAQEAELELSAAGEGIFWTSEGIGHDDKGLKVDQVALGKDMKNGREVAVKIVKNHRHWAEQARCKSSDLCGNFPSTQERGRRINMLVDNVRFEISVLKKLLKVQMQGLPSTEHANVVSFRQLLSTMGAPDKAIQVTLLDSFEFRNHINACHSLPRQIHEVQWCQSAPGTQVCKKPLGDSRGDWTCCAPVSRSPALPAPQPVRCSCLPRKSVDFFFSPLSSSSPPFYLSLSSSP
eukprot:768792-Hanusia_phi.AAC.11